MTTPIAIRLLTAGLRCATQVIRARHDQPQVRKPTAHCSHDLTDCSHLICLPSLFSTLPAIIPGCLHEASNSLLCARPQLTASYCQVGTQGELGVNEKPLKDEILFVANHGPQFEKRILVQNTGNAKFSFLSRSDPYHSYYQHRISEFQAAQQSTPWQPADSAAAPEAGAAAPAMDCKEEAAHSNSSALFKPPVHKVLEPPEAEQAPRRDYWGRTGYHQAYSPPTHSMFMFFTALADSYSKVLMPPKGLTDKLRKSVTDMTTVLEQCLHRLGWERSQKQARQKAEDEIEQERMQMAMIDWHEW
ncbi:hypothetical protein ACLOJK_040923 [Asimina triloba]